MIERSKLIFYKPQPRAPNILTLWSPPRENLGGRVWLSEGSRRIRVRQNRTSGEAEAAAWQAVRNGRRIKFPFEKLIYAPMDRFLPFFKTHNMYTHRNLHNYWNDTDPFTVKRERQGRCAELKDRGVGGRSERGERGVRSF